LSDQVGLLLTGSHDSGRFRHPPTPPPQASTYPAASYVSSAPVFLPPADAVHVSLRPLSPVCFCPCKKER
jgi:hypothetical protein